MEDKALTEEQKTKIEQLKKDGIPPIKAFYMSDEDLEKICKELLDEHLFKY